MESRWLIREDDETKQRTKCVQLPRHNGAKQVDHEFSSAQITTKELAWTQTTNQCQNSEL
ncbi:hypothetical protein NQZ68_023294 [Dissostichus eleginoides]|nr:hypothetical protein NQZ68_023294 [Dissostichus eleginoides]